MFRLVIDDVFDATGTKQAPFMYRSLPGRQDFYFCPTVVASTAKIEADVGSPMSNNE